MMRILGGLPFALFLIASTLLFVVAGTVIESRTGSHEEAERIVYGSLPFKLLLLGFFINILFSTFRRWPFKKSHLPFIVTHIGLLMVIAGIFIKTVRGVQGALLLTEGEASDQLKIPMSLALYSEDMAGNVEKLPLSGKLPMRTKLLKGKESFSSWIVEGELRLLGLPPMKLPIRTEAILSGEKYALYADTKAPPQALFFSPLPWLYFQDREEEILLYRGDGKGGLWSQKLSKGLKESYAAYLKGLQGYTSIISIGGLELESPLLRKISFEKSGAPCLFLEGGTPILLNSPLKTAFPKEQKLLSLSEDTLTLPFEVRLHKAEEIKYPGSPQTASYNCTLSLIQNSTPHRLHLTMNKVGETKEGYRLYLSGMSSNDPHGVKSVQIVVNYDPARFILTYPGGILTALGSLALLFGTRRKH